MKCQVALVLFGLACSALTNPTSNVAPQIYKNLEENELTNVLVTFKKANPEAAMARYDALNLTTREAKLNTMYAILKDHADIVQSRVLDMLKEDQEVKKYYSNQLWISSELVIRDVDKETVDKLSQHPDVKSLEAEFFIPLEDVIEEGPELTADDFEVQWGVDNIRTGAVWAQGNRGQGQVIANIDTGVRHTHQALVGNYRGTRDGTHNYNWFAPTGQAAVPSDTNGHGTHVAGTTNGITNNIGVAPDATWIACRGCAGAGCSNFDLLGCGNWVACPTTTSGGAANCARAPHVCNNSWGGGRGSTFYDGIIAAWLRAEIVPIFSAGNSGPGCNTVISPSDRPGAISIGSTAANNQISGFSSRGPAINGVMKPDVSAPGTSVVSASHLSDTGYRTLSGTSMAAPHVAGVCALMKTRRPGITVPQILTALRNGSALITSSGQTCSGVPDTARPNHQLGYGRIDALNCVNAAASV